MTLCTASTTPPTGITYTCTLPHPHPGVSHSAPIQGRRHDTKEVVEFSTQSFTWSDRFAQNAGWEVHPHEEEVDDDPRNMDLYDGI